MITPAPVLDWYKLHRALWHFDRALSPDTMAHPARFARLLIREIYTDARARGFVAPGGIVFDPFGGTGLGAFDAMANGLTWHGIEIEPKHAATGAANIDAWARLYSGTVSGWGKAHMILGDSRNAAALLPAGVVGRVNLIATSPPYADVIRKSKDGPGVRHDRTGAHGPNSFVKKGSDRVYGQAIGQLDALPMGDPDNPAPNTFWGEAAAVVRACHSVMAPGGVAFWNVRDYVRAGAVVEFGRQWRALCEANGWATLYMVRSWLIESRGIQYDIEGRAIDKPLARKSQPRRVAEKKGAPPIDFEWVIVTRRPPDMI